jgi:hypothetical protein
MTQLLNWVILDNLNWNSYEEENINIDITGNSRRLEYSTSVTPNVFNEEMKIEV